MSEKKRTYHPVNKTLMSDDIFAGLPFEYWFIFAIAMTFIWFGAAYTDHFIVYTLTPAPFIYLYGWYRTKQDKRWLRGMFVVAGGVDYLAKRYGKGVHHGPF